MHDIRRPRRRTSPFGSNSFSTTCSPLIIVRQFDQDELDLDDLAEAIRLLLDCDCEPSPEPQKQDVDDLLLLPTRVTHVVEAEKAL
jgi:hypothetical protein